MTYRWTINLNDGQKIKSVSVVAKNDLEVLSKVHSRYPGYEVVFMARMEALTT